MSADEKRPDRGAFVELEELVARLGISVFGVADLSGYAPTPRYVPQEVVGDLSKGVVLGCRLSDRVMESLVDGPTPTYRYHYRQVNSFLDSAATAVTVWIQGRGYSAFPVPSSQILDWRENKGHIWHVAVACLAGVAWWGRNNLAVTENFGARVRYATVLTDMPLPAGRRMQSRCGDCYECVEACPVEAIHESPEDFELLRCQTLLRKFSKELGLGVQICGLCVKACRGRLSWRPRSLPSSS